MKQLKKILLFTIGLLALFSLGNSTNEVSAASKYKTAHLWKFTYDHDSVNANNISGEVAVQVVKYDRATLDVVQVLSEEVYAVPCAEKSVDTIECELNIQDNINETYAKAGINRFTPSSEAYGEFIIESVGSWSSLSLPTGSEMASHPSLKYALQTKGNSARFSADTNGNSAKGKSGWYRPTLGETYKMTTLFTPTSTGQKMIYKVEDVKTGKEKTYGSETLPASSTVNFQLAPSTLTITIPNGFNLETFVIDPPKWGFG